MINKEIPSLNSRINNINLKIFEHGILTAGKEWTFHNLSSPFDRLYFITSGSANISGKDGSIDLCHSNAYLIPLNNAYTYNCTDRLEKFYIHFRLEYAPGFDLFEGCKTIGALSFSHNDTIKLIELANSHELSAYVTLKGLLMKTMGEFLSSMKIPLSDQVQLGNKYMKLYRFLNENCNAQLRVNDLAEHLGKSASGLSKNFKNDTGITLASTYFLY